MSTRKLDDKKITATYEKWNPAKETVDALCKRLGISKQSLYLVLKRNDVTPKNQRGEVGSTREILTDIQGKLDKVLVHLEGPTPVPEASATNSTVAVKRSPKRKPAAKVSV